MCMGCVDVEQGWDYFCVVDVDRILGGHDGSMLQPKQKHILYKWMCIEFNVLFSSIDECVWKAKEELCQKLFLKLMFILWSCCRVNVFENTNELEVST